MSIECICTEQEAMLFAKSAHEAVEQRRKYTHQPYIVHPAGVVHLLKKVDHSLDMIIVGWLHDVLEDTLVTEDEIREKFGDRILSMLKYLTKTDYGNNKPPRQERLEVEIKKLQKAPGCVKSIKLADIIDNTKTLEELDPEFSVTYFKEKRLFMPVLKGGDPRLFEIAASIIGYKDPSIID